MLLHADRVSVVLDGATLLPPTTLQVEAGECVALLGQNGAGKTTMLRVLAGRMRATGGTAKLRGAPVVERRREVRRDIAALIDPPTLYPDLTLRENLALIEAAWSGEGRGSGIVDGLGTDALSAFGLTHLADRFGHELSSGQRQLTSLAVTFARPAGVLLLDEPEQRLDPDRRELVGEAMLDARRRGMAVVFASHDAELVARVAYRSVLVGE